MTGSAIYWSVDTSSDWGNGTPNSSGTMVFGGSVSTAALDGSNVTANLVTGTAGVSALAVSGSNLVAMNTTLDEDSQLGSIPLSGGAASSIGLLPTTLTSPTYGVGMALSGSTIYYVDQNYMAAPSSIPPIRYYGSLMRVSMRGDKATSVIRRLANDITSVAVG